MHVLRDWPWLLGILILLSFGLGRMALVDPDEGRYAATSIEMLRSGDPIVPHFNGAPRLNKPPLIYWLQAAAFAVAGRSEAAARLPSLLAALATVALCYGWAGRRFGPAAAAPTAAALATCLIFFSCARLGITDMLLTLWVTACLLLWHESVREAGLALRRRLALAASVSAGLAALAKGHVGLMLVLVVILAASALARQRRAITPAGIGWALCGTALAAGPWAAGLVGRIGVEGVVALLQREAIERAASGLDHPRPFWYLLASFWATFLPWSLAAPWAVVSSWRLRLDPATALVLAWLCGTLVFFSIPVDKNDAYLLPAAPALALLVGSRLPRRLVGAVSAATGLFLISAVLLASDRFSAERSLRQAAADAGLDGRGAYRLIAYRLHRPSLVYYADRPATWVSSGRELRELLERTPPAESMALVMEESRLERMQAGGSGGAVLLAGFERVGGQPGIVVLWRQAGPQPP